MIYIFFKDSMLSQVVLGLFLLPLLSEARVDINKSYITLQVDLHDSTLLKSSSMLFTVLKDEVNTESSPYLDFYEQEISGISTTFNIPLSSSVNYARISFKSLFLKRGIYDGLKTTRNLYIFEQGDNVKISIYKDTIIFKGKGSDKYNLLYALSAVQPGNEHPVLSGNLPDEIKNKLILNYGLGKLDSIYSLKLSMLQKFKGKVNQEIYDLIGADLWGEHNRTILGRFYNVVISGPNPTRSSYMHDIVFEAYHKYNENFKKAKYNVSALVKSYRYCDFLFYKEIFTQKIFGNPTSERYNLRFKFGELYTSVMKHYDGTIFDKLILITFLEATRMPAFKSTLFTGAIAKMGNNIFKEKLVGFRENITGNAFAFELPDKDGKIHKLSDYQGKLIVMDFWFTGCLACAQLQRKLKPIKESYRQNPEIVFVTVSIDLKREMWQASLDAEIYSSKNDINLYTNGLGKNHPLIKHYNISAYPSLILIDSTGKVVSVSFPDDSLVGKKPFISLLNQYLRKGITSN